MNEFYFNIIMVMTIVLAIIALFAFRSFLNNRIKSKIIESQVDSDKARLLLEDFKPNFKRWAALCFFLSFPLAVFFLFIPEAVFSNPMKGPGSLLACLSISFVLYYFYLQMENKRS